jgi:hypothetical protein
MQIQNIIFQMVEVSNHHQLHHQEEAEHGGAPEIQTN